jgi:hypothetical protein
MSFDENDNTRMSSFFNLIKRFRRYCGYPTIILIHHMKKIPANGVHDIRDMIRGASDLVAAPDSVIGLERKTGKECFLLHQMKCRASLEKDKILVMVSGGKELSHFHQSENSDMKIGIKDTAEKAAEEVLAFAEKNKKPFYERKEISDFFRDKISDTMVFRALKVLEEDGLVIKEGRGKNVKWVFGDLGKSCDDGENKVEGKGDGKEKC